jgi:hypothetical protein
VTVERGVLRRMMLRDASHGLLVVCGENLLETIIHNRGCPVSSLFFAKSADNSVIQFPRPCQR